MAINVIVQYNGGFLPDIILLTQAPNNVVWFHGPNIVYYCYPFLIMYYIVFCFVLVGGPAWAINLSVHYDCGLLPDIMLLTQGYFHRGTCLNAIKRFCFCSL